MMQTSASPGLWLLIGCIALLVVGLRSRSKRPGPSATSRPIRVVPSVLRAPAVSPPRNMDALPLPQRTIRAKPLLSPWEKAAIDTLGRQLPSTHRLCPQVRLLDMLAVQDNDRSRERTTINRLSSKSVDFAIIDANGCVVLVIELNDKSHDRPDRRDRDELVRVALEQANIPLAIFRPRQPLDLRPWLAAA